MVGTSIQDKKPNIGVLSVNMLKEASETCGFPMVHLKLYSELGWAASSISRVLN